MDNTAISWPMIQTVASVVLAGSVIVTALWYVLNGAFATRRQIEAFGLRLGTIEAGMAALPPACDLAELKCRSAEHGVALATLNAKMDAVTRLAEQVGRLDAKVDALRMPLDLLVKHHIGDQK